MENVICILGKDNCVIKEKSIEIKHSRLQIFGYDCVLSIGTVFLPLSQISITESNLTNHLGQKVDLEVSIPYWLMQKIAKESLLKLNFPKYNNNGVEILENDDKRSNLNYMLKNLDKITLR